MHTERHTQINELNPSKVLQQGIPSCTNQELELVVRQAERATSDANREERRASITFSCFMALVGIDAVSTLAS